MMKNDIKYKIFTGIIVLFIALLKIYLTDITFFWDSIACLSNPAYFFYENDLQTLIYQGALDNGDPHVIQYYLSVIWSIFGKNLLVSHLAFLPIVVGAVYQIILLCKKTLAPDSQKNAFVIFLLGSILVLSDPTVLTQIILLGTDLFAIFFAVYCLNKILSNEKTGLSFGFIGLCLTTRRGMIIAATLMIAYVIKIFLLEKKAFSTKEFFKVIAPTLPACFTVFGYLLFRFGYHGWVFSDPNSAWAETSEIVTFYGFIRNLAVFIWRNIDFGRIGLWVVLFFMFVKFGYKRLFNTETRFLWICYFLLQFSFMCVTLTITNPFGARYFVIQFILLAVIVIKLLFDLFKQRQAEIISCLLIVVSLTGNLWLYPEKTSQNWDCTLKHLPFYSLRSECLDYMEKHNIAYDQTAAGFCLYGDQKYIDLIEQDRFISGQIKEDTKFFLYSNISNLDDESIEDFHSTTKWSKVKTFEKGGIFIQLLSRNEETE